MTRSLRVLAYASLLTFVAACSYPIGRGEDSPMEEATPHGSAKNPNCDLAPARRTSRTVLVYLQKTDIAGGSSGDRRNFVAAERRITDAEARAPLRAAVRKLMEGPTRRERRLGCVSNLSHDAHLLADVALLGGEAVIDFAPAFPRELGIVSTTHAGTVFLTQLELTAFQFPNVRSIRLEIDGSCEAFGEFMQAGECVTLRREPES